MHEKRPNEISRENVDWVINDATDSAKPNPTFPVISDVYKWNDNEHEKCRYFHL